MKVLPAGFPIEWLEGQGAATATDLDLVILLVNTHDLLEDPPDRLADVTWLQSALTQVGHGRIARDLRHRDLAALRELRLMLRALFEAPDAAAAARLLNPHLRQAGAVHELVVESHADDDRERVRFLAGHDRRGLEALSVRLPVAVAEHITAHGVRRLGICGSDPCRCAFVDRTRAATRRYCCVYCNDRHAARAYRARKRG